MIINLRKIAVLRLVLGLIILTLTPQTTEAALIDVNFNGLNSWLKEKALSTPANFVDDVEIDLVYGDMPTVGGVALIPSNKPFLGVAKMFEVTLTGYSSSIDETDSTPLITASGAWVGDGVVAANFLPFGTKIRVPELFGNKIFTVKDRMNKKHTDKIDIWFESKDLAKIFGKRKAQIQVLAEDI